MDTESNIMSPVSDLTVKTDKADMTQTEGGNYMMVIDGVIYIRKSMMESYEFCPMQFFKSWPVPGSGLDNPVDKDNYIMRAGLRFHEFGYTFFDFCRGVDPEEWEKFIPPEFSIKEREMAEYFIQEERKRYYQLKEMGRLDEFQPILREQQLIMHDLKITGSFDRADWWDKDNEEVTIIEYKTGQSFYLPSILRQLAFYAIMWEGTLNMGKVTHMTVINPRLKITRSFEMNHAQIEKVLKTIIEMKRVMNSGGPYPRKCSPNKLAICRMCKPSESGVYDSKSRWG